MGKQIDFQGNNKNFYHTLKRSDVKVEGQMKNGSAVITGFTKQDISSGDDLNILGCNYRVVGLLERRNHAGVFTNEEDRENSFFKVETVFSELIKFS